MVSECIFIFRASKIRCFEKTFNVLSLVVDTTVLEKISFCTTALYNKNRCYLKIKSIFRKNEISLAYIKTCDSRAHEMFVISWLLVYKASHFPSFISYVPSISKVWCIRLYKTSKLLWNENLSGFQIC